MGFFVSLTSSLSLSLDACLPVGRGEGWVADAPQPLWRRRGEGEETSMGYTHAINEDLMKIENSLDQIMQKERGGNP
jgi:hypothetical protein